MEKKTYIFYLNQEEQKIADSIECWKLFLTSQLGGAWNNDEIKAVAFSSYNDILNIWKYEDKLEYVQVIVLCDEQTNISDKFLTGGSGEKIPLLTFIPECITDKILVLFDSIVSSSSCYRQISQAITRVNAFMIRQLLFYLNYGKAKDVFDSCLQESLPGIIIVKPVLFSSSQNLLNSIADFILNSGDRGIVPYGARLGLFPHPVGKLLKQINTFVPKAEHEKYHCIRYNGNGSFPLAVLHWIKG